MYEILSPGLVGPVGDVLVNTRLKHSAPDFPLRWQYTLNEMERIGNNVQNGFPKNYQGNGPAPSILPVGMLVNKNGLETKYGWKFQDLRAPDKAYQPEMSQTFGNFDNQRASIINATRTGIQFNKLPYGYMPRPGDVPRGGAVPRVTDLAAGDFTLGTGIVTAGDLGRKQIDQNGYRQQDGIFGRRF